MTQSNQMTTLRNLRVGDIVEQVYGKYKGIRAKVIAVQPADGPFAIKIMVDIKYSDYIFESYNSFYSATHNIWLSSRSWKKIE